MPGNLLTASFLGRFLRCPAASFLRSLGGVCANAPGEGLLYRATRHSGPLESSRTARASCGRSPGSFASSRAIRLRSATLAVGTWGTLADRCASLSAGLSSVIWRRPAEELEADAAERVQVCYGGDHASQSSGAMYGGDPQPTKVGFCVPISSSRAIPKSASFHRPPCASTLAGFRSRWMMPIEWSCWSPAAMSVIAAMAVASSSGSGVRQRALCPDHNQKQPVVHLGHVDDRQQQVTAAGDAAPNLDFTAQQSIISLPDGRVFSTTLTAIGVPSAASAAKTPPNPPSVPSGWSVQYRHLLPDCPVNSTSLVTPPGTPWMRRSLQCPFGSGGAILASLAERMRHRTTLVPLGWTVSDCGVDLRKHLLRARRPWVD